MDSASSLSVVSRGIGIDHYSNQRISSTVRMHVRKGQLTFAFIKCLCALCITAEVKGLVLFAGDAAICIVRSPNQALDLFQRHADFQFVEFAARGGRADDFAFDQPVCRLHYPYVCICGIGFLK